MKPMLEDSEMERGTSPSRPWLVSAGLVGVGIGMMLAGWRSQGYASATWLQVGSAFLLVAPLYYLTRLLGQQVQRVQQSTAQVANRVEHAEATLARLEDLTARTEEQAVALTEADQRAVDVFENEFGWRAVHDLLARGRKLDAIAIGGVRVRVPHMWERVRFVPPPGEGSTPDERLRIVVEGLGGDEKGLVEWRDGEPAEAMTQRLVEELQRIDRFPAGGFDVTAMLRQLLTTVEIAVRNRREGLGLDLAPLVEVFGTQWAITTFGLQRLDLAYPIPHADLEPDTRIHVSRKSGIDQDDFDEAFRAAEALHVKGQPNWITPEQE
jgi:hypothetical protein